MPRSNAITVTFTRPQLSEVLAKLANELDLYDDTAPEPLISAFVAVSTAAKLAKCTFTTLATEFHEQHCKE
jgi:hypothetical protein